MRPSILRPDDDGAIDVPFKLLLSMVLIAMAATILFPVLQSYQQSEMEHRLDITLAEIQWAVMAVQRHPGSSRTVLVDLPPSGSIRLNRLIIGGDLSSSPAEVGTISWSLSNGVSGTTLVSSSSGPVPMAGPDGKALVVDSFPCLLVIEQISSPPGADCPFFVQVRIV